MTKATSAILPFLLVLVLPLVAQTNVYSNPALGFRYTPPHGMQDTTARSKQQMRARATARRTRNTLDLLLSMSSGEDDSAISWHSLSVETYPREALRSLNDFAAEARMSAWVGGHRSLDSPPQSVVFAGQDFVLSGFQEQEGRVTKYARI